MRQPRTVLAWIALGLTLLVLAGPRAWAQESPAYLVKDIEPTGEPFVIPHDDGSYSYFYGSTPRQLTEYDGVLLFVARDVAHGFELWRSDGTAEGTLRVKDICPGECSSELYLMGAYRDRFYFIASDGVAGRELWRTDGTEAATERVTDICPGTCGIAPMLYPLDPYYNPWVVYRDVLYFAASSGAPWPSLWRTDGTAEETWKVRSTCVGECGFYYPLHSLVAYNDRLYFSGGTDRDLELWASDGTTAGTTEVVDLCGGNSGSSLPMGLHVFRSELYFATICGPGTGPSIFKTNGTAEGTVQLATYPIGMAQTGFVEFRDLLFFDGGGGQLWRTDGTPQGTYGVADFGQLGQLSVLGDKLIFPATRTFAGNATLWVSDGTGAGTSEIPEGQIESGGVYVFDGKALFGGGYNLPGEPLADELWITDGTSEGTSLLQEIHPGPIGSVPAAFRQVGSRIFFIAAEPTHGTELWALPRTVLTGPRCFDEPTKLCLQDGRFEVSVRFRNQHAGGAEGVGRAVPWSRESGTFTFFDPENTELVVKVLDGRPVNGAFWLFYGALSDVEYWIEVKDWQTGITRGYHNEPGRICGDAFLGDFPAPAGAASSSPVSAPQAAPTTSTVAVGSCVPSSERLCLLEGRVEVTADWRNQHGGGAEGGATVLSATAKSGFFSFFQPGNIELVVKALDGTAVNGKIWFFYGALSDVEYWITVRDTLTGAARTYHNPPGRICGVGDTGAL